MDVRTHHFDRMVRERTYDLTPGTERARDVYASLMAELTALRPFIPRQESVMLEVLVETRCGMKG